MQSQFVVVLSLSFCGIDALLPQCARGSALRLSVTDAHGQPLPVMQYNQQLGVRFKS
jgi:hypothetical protein